MKGFPPSLRLLLENPEIVKLGVGIQGDAKLLHRSWNVSMASCIDLSLFARSIDSLLFANGLGRYGSSTYVGELEAAVNPRPVQRVFQGRYTDGLGLATLFLLYRHKSLVKGSVTTSDWSADLSSEQLDCASLLNSPVAMSLHTSHNDVDASEDAIAGYLVFFSVLEEAAILPTSQIPKRGYFMFDAVDGLLYPPLRGEKRDITTLPLTVEQSQFSKGHIYIQEYRLSLGASYYPLWTPNNPEYIPILPPLDPVATAFLVEYHDSDLATLPTQVNWRSAFSNYSILIPTHYIQAFLQRAPRRVPAS
ncbi:hypothetical protein VNI00_017957 [Paramarasmius palmivorus]|uniref:Uncharacterized protein n=1 Tax=Paramarasmius palmivorus TaxID=297713 RepID=A0AAW0B209_9AGAR